MVVLGSKNEEEGKVMMRVVLQVVNALGLIRPEAPLF